MSRRQSREWGARQGLSMERAVTRITDEVTEKALSGRLSNRTSENQKVSHRCRGTRPSGHRVDCAWLLTSVTMRMSLYMGQSKEMRPGRELGLTC